MEKMKVVGASETAKFKAHMKVHGPSWSTWGSASPDTLKRKKGSRLKLKAAGRTFGVKAGGASRALTSMVSGKSSGRRLPSRADAKSHAIGLQAQRKKGIR
jgi:hypothetical protein